MRGGFAIADGVMTGMIAVITVTADETHNYNCATSASGSNIASVVCTQNL
jgi:hypothetical protein